MKTPNQRISCETYLKFEREDSITKTENSYWAWRERHPEETAWWFVLVPADKADSCVEKVPYRDFNKRIGYQHHQYQSQLHMYPINWLIWRVIANL